MCSVCPLQGFFLYVVMRFVEGTAVIAASGTIPIKNLMKKNGSQI
jgi:hypothetical protein